MIINGSTLLEAAPIKDMLNHKAHNGDTSYGLSEAGYDIRIKQEVRFYPKGTGDFTGDYATRDNIEVVDSSRPFLHRVEESYGRFTLASAIEEFQMPYTLVGYVKDKSTWARRGLSVFNTVIEPAWRGFLTLELVYHGEDELIIPAGSGIAQVLFHQTVEEGFYNGKYQNQEDRPVEARASK